jgi:hypothetical protein
MKLASRFADGDSTDGSSTLRGQTVPPSVACFTRLERSARFVAVGRKGDVKVGGLCHLH